MGLSLLLTALQWNPVSGRERYAVLTFSGISWESGQEFTVITARILRISIGERRVIKRSLIRLLGTLVERFGERRSYYGHVVGSPYFWGDLCREKFRFVRNFAFRTLDSGAISPHGPYKLDSTPWVNYWFSTADAPDVRAFNRLVTPAALDRLREERGVCILSTHFGKGFVRNGRVDPQVEDTFRYLATQPGWFVTVSEVLEYMLSRRAEHTLATWDQWKLETRHVADRLLARVLSPTSLPE